MNLQCKHLSGEPGSQASIGISCKIGTFGHALYCTIHSAVTQPGRLLQQPYIERIGVTSPGEPFPLSAEIPYKLC